MLDNFNLTTIMANNGDTKRVFTVGTDHIRGVGSFHKTLPHNEYGEVINVPVPPAPLGAFDQFVAATEGTVTFTSVPAGPFQPPNDKRTAQFVNPQAGLAHDHLTRDPAGFDMPPAPEVLSITTAAEMTELYWMALLRDKPFDAFDSDSQVAQAATEIHARYKQATKDNGDAGHLKTGIDVPGPAGTLAPITPQNVFRLGLPGEEVGPLVSQFFIRDIGFGTQSISQKERPYARDLNYLTTVASWKHAQDSGNGDDGLAYNRCNEVKPGYYQFQSDGSVLVRHISTMRDLARFVNKDALHQAYFNATLLLLSDGAQWTPGNPYAANQPLEPREAGFGTLGGPHILALVSEVATRALKVVWNQKWQVNLRLRPEAYAGLVHMQTIGIDVNGANTKRPYGLPSWVATTKAAKMVRTKNAAPSKDADGNTLPGEDTLLLPMAFTAGSPAHPAYGAGHACVAGACVTVLKAFFKTFDCDQNGNPVPLPLSAANPLMPNGSLIERTDPYAAPTSFQSYKTGTDANGNGVRTPIPSAGLTIEGELNKLAMNVAMGRSMGGVHWRTDNTRSFNLGEAMAAQILADITSDLNEHMIFTFRTFSRKSNGEPKIVTISQGRIHVDGVLVDSHTSAL